MSNLIPFRKPMRPHEFEAEVKDRAKVSHMIFQTDHLKEKMIERGITSRQVLNVLRKGSVSKGPDWNEATASNEGHMTYHGTGREITVRCAIRNSDLFIFGITTY